MSRKLDITWKRFGKLTALKTAGSSSRGQLLWHCRCDCGNETIVAGAKLRNGHTRSCGCLKSVGAAQFIEEALQTDTDACILWPYGRRVRGYGAIAVNRRPQLVSRLVCERAHGAGGQRLALHSCDTPACINKRHLSWGTQSDNVQQMWDRGRR